MSTLSLTNKSYDTYDNLLLTGTKTDRPLYVENCHDLIFDTIEIDGKGILDNTFGHLVSFNSCYNITVRNLIIHDGGNFTGTTYGGGLGINKGCHDFLVENTQSYNHWEYCMQCYSDDIAIPVYNIVFSNNTIYGSLSHGLNVGWYCENITVEKNFSHSNARYGIVVDSGILGSFIKNNICYNNLYNMGSENDALHGKSQNIQFYNNTLIYGPATSSAGFRFADGLNGDNYDVKNNIVVASSDSDYLINDVTNKLTNFTSDNNCFYNTTGNQPKFKFGGVTYNSLALWKATGKDVNSISDNPKLTSDYRLQSDSPCFKAGLPISTVTDDYAGFTRPTTLNTIGAYQYPYTAYQNQGELMSTYKIPIVNSKPPQLVDLGFYADVRFDPHDALPTYIGLNLENNASTGADDWKIYRFTYSGSNVTRIQVGYGSWDARTTTF
jgi:hypothetical protein